MAIYEKYIRRFPEVKKECTKCEYWKECKGSCSHCDEKKESKLKERNIKDVKPGKIIRDGSGNYCGRPRGGGAVFCLGQSDADQKGISTYVSTGDEKKARVARDKEKEKEKKSDIQKSKDILSDLTI